jgi:hypothetical protein
MTDNLLQLIEMQPDIIVAELIDRTKNCAITWNSITHTTYSTNFLWRSDYYDVYITLIRNGYVLDVVKNKRKVLNLSSYINDQLQVLYYVITDTMKEQTIKQIIQDLNSLPTCIVEPRVIKTGGVVAGGLSVTSILHSVQAVVYMAAPSVSGGSLQSLHNTSQINTILTNRKNIDDVAADTANEKIFWTQNQQIDGLPSGCALYSCNLEGTGVTTVLYFPDFDNINCISLDKNNQHIYYIQQKLNSSNLNVVYDVRRCDYNGSNVISISDGNVYVCSPTSIDVDTVHEYVYWCDNKGLTEGYVHRSNFDGSGVMTLMSTGGYVRTVFVWGDYLYLGGPGLFVRTNLGGGSEEYLPTTGLSVIDDITVYGSTVYLLDIGLNKIVSTNSEGANLQILVNDSISRTGIGAS